MNPKTMAAVRCTRLLLALMLIAYADRPAIAQAPAQVSLAEAGLRVGINTVLRDERIPIAPFVGGPLTGNTTIGQIEPGVPTLAHVHLPNTPPSPINTESGADHPTAVVSTWLGNRPAGGGLPAVDGYLRANPILGGGAKVKAVSDLSGIDMISDMDWLFTGVAPTVINASAGFMRLVSNDAAPGVPANQGPSRIVDSFIWSNPNTTFVAAAGNFSTKIANRLPGVPAAAVNNIITPIGDTFNGISVARTNLAMTGVDADSLVGPTGDGRRKPDIAAPGSRIFLLTAMDLNNDNIINDAMPTSGTSFATPIVTAGVALMQDWALHNGAGPGNRMDHRVIRSVLMTTADKNIMRTGGGNIAEMARGAAGNDLDNQAGAGQMQLADAMGLYKRAQANPANPVGGIGWDFRNVAAGAPVIYDLGRLERDDRVYATLSWSRQVNRALNAAGDADDTFTVPANGLQDLDLAFRRVGAAGNVDNSNLGSGDTNEHMLTLPGMDGAYRLAVTNSTGGGNARAEAYSLSWRVQPFVLGRKIRALFRQFVGGVHLPSDGGGSIEIGPYNDVEIGSPDFAAVPAQGEDLTTPPPDLNLPSDAGSPDARLPSFVPLNLSPNSWSNGANDLWSLATPNQGARVMFSVDGVSMGVPALIDPLAGPIDNDVNAYAALGVQDKQTYYSSVLIRNSSLSPALAADGVTGNFYDVTTPTIAINTPTDLGDVTEEFDALTAMEGFGVRQAMRATDRNPGALQAIRDFAFFSTDGMSPLLAGFSTADILAIDPINPNQMFLYASGTQLGLSPSDVIDGLVVDDDGALDAMGRPFLGGSDRILFSLQNGNSLSIGGADLRLLDAALGSSQTLVMGAQLGLLPMDNIVGLDVLDHVPEPSGLLLLACACLGLQRRQNLLAACDAPRATDDDAV